MSREEADRTLARLRDEKERIGGALLELEAHQGYQLLEGAALTGETLRVQSDVRSRMASLWTLFDLYGRAVDAAGDLRARHSRPGQPQLAELVGCSPGRRWSCRSGRCRWSGGRCWPSRPASGSRCGRRSTG